MGVSLHIKNINETRKYRQINALKDLATDKNNLLYQFLINKLEKAETKDIEKNEIMFIDSLKLIHKYTDFQIYWVTKENIYTADVIIKKMCRI